MKKFKGKILLLLIVLTITVLLPFSAYAAFSAEPVITPDKTEVLAGDTISFTIKFSDIVDPGTGINTLGGYLNYDTDFFESIEGIEPNTNNNGKFVIMKLSGSPVTTSNQTFATFSIKVKSDAKGTGTMTFSELEFATPDGNEYKITEPIELSFTIPTKDEEPGKDNTTPQDNTTSEDNTTPGNTAGGNSSRSNGNTTSTTNSQSGKTDTTTASKSILPQAGIKTGIVIGIIILVAGAIYSYKLAKKYRNV